MFANSCHDEVAKDADSELKSADLKKKEVLDGVKSWFESNPERNTFELLKWTDEIKWSSAQVMEIDNSVVVEVQVKLKEKHKVMAEKDPSINVDHRLLFIKEKGTIISYMEYFISSKKDLDYLQDTEKVNYSKKGKDFDGTIVLESPKKEIKVVSSLKTGDECGELRLKNASTICMCLVEEFIDGSIRIIRVLYCWDSGDGGTGGGGGTTPPPTTIPCDCNTCPICGKCLTLLKSAPVDGDGGGTPATAACEMCTGHQVPIIELTSSFENNPKVMCVYSNLIRTVSSTFNPMVTSFLANFSDGVSFNPGNATFTVGDVVDAYGQPIDAYGSCSGNSNDECLITIDKDYINNRSSLEIAKTMMHEILHAKIFHSKLTTSGAFENMFAQYISYTEGKQYVDQHQLMLDNYVEPMVRFLKDYDSKNGYSAPEEYYRAIALNGLPNLTSSEKTQISNAEIYFRNRGLNCQ